MSPLNDLQMILLNQIVLRGEAGLPDPSLADETPAWLRPALGAAVAVLVQSGLAEFPYAPNSPKAQLLVATERGRAGAGTESFRLELFGAVQPQAYAALHSLANQVWHRGMQSAGRTLVTASGITIRVIRTWDMIDEFGWYLFLADGPTSEVKITPRYSVHGYNGEAVPTEALHYLASCLMI